LFNQIDFIQSKKIQSPASDVSGQKTEPQPPPPPPLISSVSTSLQDATKPLKETLDKINMLEQTTVSLDKQSAGIQRMVTEVVKKQEENTSVRKMFRNIEWS
jgi:hypothetical protein